MAISAEHSQNLQPFTGNGNVFEWVKNSWVGRNTQKKQTKTCFSDWSLRGLDSNTLPSAF